MVRYGASERKKGRGTATHRSLGEFFPTILDDNIQLPGIRSQRTPAGEARSQPFENLGSRPQVDSAKGNSSPETPPFGTSRLGTGGQEFGGLAAALAHYHSGGFDAPSKPSIAGVAHGGRFQGLPASALAVETSPGHCL